MAKVRGNSWCENFPLGKGMSLGQHRRRIVKGVGGAAKSRNDRSTFVRLHCNRLGPGCMARGVEDFDAGEEQLVPFDKPDLPALVQLRRIILSLYRMRGFCKNPLVFLHVNLCSGAFCCVAHMIVVKMCVDNYVNVLGFQTFPTQSCSPAQDPARLPRRTTQNSRSRAGA